MTSLRKLIAAAAVGLPLAALAQTPPAPAYQIYGTLNYNTHYFEASKPFKSGATDPQNATGRWVSSIDSTNIGIKGQVDTGKFGLSVVWQCETSAPIDGVTGSVNPVSSGGAPVASALQVVCNRNSRLGLTNPQFGTLFFGNWDTPYKAIYYGTKADDAMGNTDVFDSGSIIGSPGFKTKSSAGATTLGYASVAGGATYQTDRTFNVRAANSIAYWTPKIMGLQVKAQVSVNENRATNNYSAASPQEWSPMLFAVGVNYDQGPLSVLAAYERHDDWSGLTSINAANTAGAASTVDEGYRIGAGYELANPFGTSTLGAVYERLEYHYAKLSGVAANALGGTALRSYRRGAYMVNLKHRMGDHEFRARWQQADNGECTNINFQRCNFDIGKGAISYTLGYAYYLNTATQLYAFFTKIENERTASYTFATAGANAVTGSWGGGADPLAAGLGMRYAF